MLKAYKAKRGAISLKLAGADAYVLGRLKGLRHTHATLLLELGEHPKVVQERLGHSTITTTMTIYSHVTPTMQSPQWIALQRTSMGLSTYVST